MSEEEDKFDPKKRHDKVDEEEEDYDEDDMDAKEGKTTQRNNDAEKSVKATLDMSADDGVGNTAESDDEEDDVSWSQEGGGPSGAPSDGGQGAGRGRQSRRGRSTGPTREDQQVNSCMAL